MSKIDNGGPAFPVPLNPGHSWNEMGPCDGMTLRQYAAIKLRVPDSGTDWLDEMIRKSMRDDFAAKAMQGMLADSTFNGKPEEIALASLRMADAMLLSAGEVKQ